MILEYDTDRLAAARRPGYQREVILEGGPQPGSIGLLGLTPDRVVVSGGAYYPSVDATSGTANWRDFFDLSKPLVYVWRADPEPIRWQL